MKLESLNTRLLFVALIALGSTLARTQGQDYIGTVTNTPNLLAYWQFDPVFQANSCVNGFTGTLQGNAQIGPPGSGCPLKGDAPTQALLLDGVNGYLSTSLTGQITNQGTVLAWVYLTAQPSAAGQIFQIASQAESGDDFDLQIQTDNRTYFYTDSGSATVYPEPLPTNQWQFLAVTFTANSARCIYLNGQLVATSTAGAHSVNNAALWIGNNPVFGPRLFQGRLDEVAVFNRALVPSEIEAIYSAAGVPAQFTFTTNGGAITITGYTGGGDVVIPAATNGYPVISIGDNAFYYNSTMTSVTIPYGVTNIGKTAFENCYGLTNVTLPDSVTSLGATAFGNCASLANVTLPDSITSIGDAAFLNCVRLTNVTIPHSVTSIANNTFANSGLTSIDIPDGVASVGNDAFNFCLSLASVTIPDSVTNLGDDAFSYCISLPGINIPASVIGIGDRVFQSCGSLAGINVDLANPAYSSLGGVLFDKAQATLIQFPSGLGGRYTIPGSVTSIGDAAFYDCESLASVIIPDSVTGIGDSAFYNCESLTGATIPNSVISIGGGAFYSCESLTSVTIPASVTNLADYAFDGCSSLTSAYFLGNAPPDDGTVFQNDTATVYYFYGATGWGSTFGGVPAVMLNLALTYAVVDGTITITGYTGSGGPVFIPDQINGTNVTSIWEYAFEDAEHVTSVRIPNSVTNIGVGSFAYCSSLPSLAIPDGVTSIGAYAFQNDVSLTSVTIPDRVTNIGDEAFLNCFALTNVNLANGLASIGQDAFFSCDRLSSVTIPGSVSSLGDYAFALCTSLTAAYFQGNAPPDDGTVFFEDPATVYYLPGTTGWGSTFGGAPAVLWNPQTTAATLTGGIFGFNISGPASVVIVVETCTNLANPAWLPVSTNTLSAGGAYTFSDGAAGNFSTRYYRLRSP